MDGVFTLYRKLKKVTLQVVQKLDRMSAAAIDSKNLQSNKNNPTVQVLSRRDDMDNLLQNQ